MSDNNSRIGGLAAINSGQIDNCFSIVRIDAKGKNIGGLIGENSGTVNNSYSYTTLKGKKAGLIGNDFGDCGDNCYFFHSEQDDSSKVRNLRDAERAISLRNWQEEDMEPLDFDRTIWEFGSRKCPMTFIADNWIHRIPKQDVQNRKQVIISTADELRQWVEQVNRGSKDMANAYVRLEEDIQLGGKEWTPIGINRRYAFAGIFDGGGHTVSNYVIRNKATENKGFFGYLLGGQVYNLSVDCQIKGGTYAGGIAAQNEKGVIGCCSATIELTGRDSTSGGLVGRNDGSIFQSYAAGRAKYIVFALILLRATPVAVLCLAAIAGATSGLIPTIQNPDRLQTFAPVPYDEDAIPIEGEELVPNTDGNFVSFQFKQEIDVDLATGLCDFEFKNPGNSNHNIVVQLQFTDAQAIRVMGSTGRSEEEQARLEALPDYDPEMNRMILAESGSVRPGYQLDNLRLVEQENGATVPPGKYNAMVYLVFYDIVSNDRAMLESQLPVEITVE